MAKNGRRARWVHYTVDKSGYGLSCGGVNATLRDFARIGLLYLNIWYSKRRANNSKRLDQ